MTIRHECEGTTSSGSRIQTYYPAFRCQLTAWPWGFVSGYSGVNRVCVSQTSVRSHVHTISKNWGDE